MLNISILCPSVKIHKVSKRQEKSFFEVLFEDNHLLVVSKAAGLLSQGDSTRDKSLVDHAKSYIKTKYDKPGKVFLGLPHRLDRPVSGIIILCRTSKALSRISEMIKKREISKHYLAVTKTAPVKPSGKLVSFIKKDSVKNRAIISDKAFEGAKEAILNYKQLGTYKDKVLLRIELITGRPHQIRAQLNMIGSPIIGDIKYSKQTPLPDKSIALHAHQLKFMHPVTKEWLQLTAPLPKKEWWTPLKQIAYKDR